MRTLTGQHNTFSEASELQTGALGIGKIGPFFLLEDEGGTKTSRVKQNLSHILGGWKQRGGGNRRASDEGSWGRNVCSESGGWHASRGRMAGAFR